MYIRYRCEFGYWILIEGRLPNICVLIWLFHTYTCTGQILLLEDKSLRPAGTECMALAYDDTLVSWDEADVFGLWDHCCQGESYCCGEGQCADYTTDSACQGAPGCSWATSDDSCDWSDDGICDEP